MVFRRLVIDGSVKLADVKSVVGNGGVGGVVEIVTKRRPVVCLERRGKGYNIICFFPFKCKSARFFNYFLRDVFLYFIVSFACLCYVDYAFARYPKGVAVCGNSSAVTGKIASVGIFQRYISYV